MVHEHTHGQQQQQQQLPPSLQPDNIAVNLQNQQPPELKPSPVPELAFQWSRHAVSRL
jgi:hypothetical protein